MSRCFLANHRRFETDDIDETRALLALHCETPNAHVRSGSYRFCWSQTPLVRASLAFIEQRGFVDLGCQGLANSVFHVAMNERGRVRLRVNGVESLQTPDRAGVHAPGQVLECSAEPIDCLVMSFDAEIVERGLRRRFDRLPPYEAWATGFSLLDGAGAAFRSLCQWTAVELDRPESVLRASSQSACTLERSLLSLFLDCLAEHYPTKSNATRDLGEGQVRFIEDWMEANLGEAVGVEEFAAVVDANNRAVQSAFRRFRGCSPTQALIRRRLDAARRSLMAPNQMTTVTAVAMDCGFFHLGRFSVRYRAAFGERPSETLARALRSQDRRDTAA